MIANLYTSRGDYSSASKDITIYKYFLATTVIYLQISQFFNALHRLLTCYPKACKLWMMAKKETKKEWDSRQIRELREHMGLTQQEMANALGTRQQTISEWEVGMYQPRGTSSTLLSIIAERAKFKYDPNATNPKK